MMGQDLHGDPLAHAGAALMQPEITHLGLEELRETVTAVASTLKAHGIWGVRYSDCSFNPIVRYVQMHLRLDDPGFQVLISGDTLCIVYSDGRKKESHLPE